MCVAIRRLLVVGLTLAASGCGQEGPRPSPTDDSAAAPPSLLQGVRIVSGVDNRPVAGATVYFEDDDGPVLSDGNGEAAPVGYISATYGTPTGSAIDVDSPGFLPRRTRIEPNRLVTLWPVADDTEAEAVRRMVYGGREVLQPLDSGPILISVLAVGPGFWASEAGESWRAEADALGRRFGIAYDWSDFFRYDFNEVSVRFGGTGGCVPNPALGFCREPASSELGSFLVLPERASDPATIRRVLASVFLGPNPLPGLMNPDAPAADLSPLEAQTIRMILLRRLPTRWPDTDR